MAAEVLAASGRVDVHLYDAKPSVGRKFLLAGKGGLNLTHSEAFEPFLARFGAEAPQIEPWLRAFDGEAVRAWARELGVETFVGTSGRVFPADLKAAPLLRAWLHRLRQAGVHFHMRHRWLGFSASGQPRFAMPNSVKGPRTTPPSEKATAAEVDWLARGQLAPPAFHSGTATYW
jgi:predicted flavoprotein YhiN